LRKSNPYRAYVFFESNEVRFVGKDGKKNRGRGGVMAQLIIVILGMVFTATGLTGMVAVRLLERQDLF
jgi:hypothetical protein